MADTDFIWRFSPGRTSPELLERIFVQRHALLADLVEKAVDSVRTGNRHHVLLIGPRGIGKTHLLTLLHHRITLDESLTDKVRIAGFKEDETITSFVQLLKRTYELLSDRYPDEFPRAWLESQLGQSVKEIQQALEKRLIAAFEAKTLLTLVENMDLIFEGLGSIGQKQWRSFMQEHPIGCLFASSQKLVDSISKRTEPFFGFFEVNHLRPLSVHDATDLLIAIAEAQNQPELVKFIRTPEGRSRVRSLHHLAGGNHRIYVVLSSFITRETLDELVQPFEKMADELTPYYQERMRWLSPQQRQIVEYLCTQLETVTPKQIARDLMAAENTISGQLKKLLELGYVLRNQSGRESLYELAEPLMQLSSEVKESRRQPLRMLVEFLRIWYGAKKLPELLEKAHSISLKMHLSEAIERSKFLPDPRLKVLEKDIDFAQADNRIDELVQLYEERVVTAPTSMSWSKLGSLHKQTGNYSDAIKCLDEALKLQPHDLLTLSEKAAALSELGRSDEEVVVYDELITRFESHLEPEVIQEVARAMFNKGVTFSQLGRTEDAIAVYDGIISRFDSREEPVILEEVAGAMLNKGVILRQLGRSEDAIVVYEAIVSRFTSGEEPAIIEDVSKAMYFKGLLLSQLGRTEDAIAAYDAMISRFEACHDPTILEHVASAMFIKGVTLSQLGRLEDAIAVYDSIVFRFASREEPAIIEQVAGAMFYKGVSLGQLGRSEVEIAAYDAMISRFQMRDEPAILENIAMAMNCKGFTLSELGRSEDEIAVYDAVIARFKSREEPEILEQVANAMTNKGFTLGELGRMEDAIAIYDAAISRFESREEPAILEQVAGVMNNKGVMLYHLGRLDDEITIYNAIISRFESRKEPAILKQVAKAMNHKGVTLDECGQFEEAVASYENSLQINDKDADTWNHKAVTLRNLGRYQDAMTCCLKALEIEPDGHYQAYTLGEIFFGMAQFGDGFQQIQECLRRWPQKNEGRDDHWIIESIRTKSLNSDAGRRHVKTLMEIYSEAKQLAGLGEELIRTLKSLQESSMNDTSLLEWGSLWQELGSHFSELELSLRIFGVGIQYLVRKDERILLNLVTPERRILRQALGLEGSDDASS